ncbi:MAG: 8-oxo-dGTP diphosphatase [Lachnospiraceae bacterium]|nr:8-oxo-dGTP diphosphatase [Lachnospiraceae bacterium]
MKKTTLCYIEKDDEYLMLHRIRKKNDVNQDKWIGIGGHFEEGETPEACILREAKEETGLTLTSFRLRGLVEFISDIWPDEAMYLFTADEFIGEMTGCDEGELEWVKKSRLPELNLWEGDYIFLELLDERESYFELRLVYEGDCLKKAVLDGRRIR